MTKNNMTIDSIIKLHFDNAKNIEAPSTSKPENNPSTYAIKGLCDSFFYMLLKIEKAQALTLSQISELTALPEKERDNDNLLYLEERSSYDQWYIKNHKMKQIKAVRGIVPVDERRSFLGLTNRLKPSGNPPTRRVRCLPDCHDDDNLYMPCLQSYSDNIL